MINFKNIKNVLIAGSIAFDYIMDFPDSFSNHLHPEKLHEINVSFIVDTLQKQLGGTATNIAYNFGRMKKAKVILLSSIGKDGAPFIKLFKKFNINTKYLAHDKKLYCSAGNVITDMKNNQIWGFYYGAAAVVPKVDFSAFDKSKTFLVLPATHMNTFSYMQKNAIKFGIPYMYDPGMGLTAIADEALREGVMNAAILIGNDYEMMTITKRLRVTVDDLAKKGIICITTLGEKGSVYQDRDQKIQVTAYKKTKPVDPTGAGDTFRAGFVSGLIEGKSVAESLKQGNALASFAVEALGTTNHKPSLKQIAARAKTLKVVR